MGTKKIIIARVKKKYTHPEELSEPKFTHSVDSHFCFFFSVFKSILVWFIFNKAQF